MATCDKPGSGRGCAITRSSQKTNRDTDMKVTLVALLAVGATTLQAQAPDTATLSAMVISATKAPASRSSLTQSVTVMSGEDLRTKGITRVSDALRLVPGASLVQNGSAGSVNTLFLRGGESRYTKVLIDGVAVN